MAVPGARPQGANTLPGRVTDRDGDGAGRRFNRVGYPLGVQTRYLLVASAIAALVILVAGAVWLAAGLR